MLVFIWTVNKCQTHTKSTLRRALTLPHPSSAQLEASPGCQGPRAAWPHHGAGRAGKGCLKAGGLGAFTSVQRRQEPQAGMGPPIWSPLNQARPRVHLRGARPGQAGSEGSPGRGWKDLVHLCSAKAAEAGTTSEASTGFRANNSTRLSVFPSVSSLAAHHCLPGRSCFLRFKAIFNKIFKNLFCNSFSSSTTEMHTWGRDQGRVFPTPNRVPVPEAWSSAAPGRSSQESTCIHSTLPSPAPRSPVPSLLLENHPLAQPSAHRGAAVASWGYPTKWSPPLPWWPTSSRGDSHSTDVHVERLLWVELGPS